MSQKVFGKRMLSSVPHIRIARPSSELAAAENFYGGGLGLDVLHRSTAVGSEESNLLMLGWPAAQWHLELTYHPTAPTAPRPTNDDLLVLYVDGPIGDSIVERLERSGGRRVASQNPYWDLHGVTIEDPDGYRLVLCDRGWSNASAGLELSR